jgi:hypothetical protein
LGLLEDRFRILTSLVDEMGSRVVLGKRPMETDVLVRQARSLFEHGLYGQSQHAIRRAVRLMDDQAGVLTAELGHYADEHKVGKWRHMASRTVEWSRTHGGAAIVVSKADRRLTLYRNGRQLVSYPVRLGYNGMLDKRYQGDGATPEGYYRITRMRDRGETEFYRALVLDYPNAEDRRRFQQARLKGIIPSTTDIGGQIEIHGGDNIILSQTLGCVMLDNAQIDALFRQVELGTPVTIVGAVNIQNAVALALAELGLSQEG